MFFWVTEEKFDKRQFDEFFVPAEDDKDQAKEGAKSVEESEMAALKDKSATADAK